MQECFLCHLRSVTTKDLIPSQYFPHVKHNLQYSSLIRRPHQNPTESYQVSRKSQLNAYLKQLSIDQRYWINEMKRLRDLAAGKDPATHLQMPENDKHHKFMRV